MNFKFVFMFLFISVFSLFSISANAETIFSGSAELAGIKNGHLENIDAKTAQINVRRGATGATVNWNTLNIPKDNTLNFYFPNANQYALNKVTNGLTTIAGNVGYAEGSQAGTVIFSNPNGIVCTGSSVINVGSLLLTTHDVTMKYNLAKLTKQVGTDGNYHGVLIEPKATLNLDNNLTIVSSGIDIDYAKITTGKDTVMLTSDGANYLLTTKETVVTKDSTVNANDVYFGGTKNTDNYGIKIVDAAIKTADGKLYLTNTAEKGSIKLMKNDIVSDVEVYAKNEVVFDGEMFEYNPWARYYLPNVITGNAIVSAPNVTIENASWFESTLDMVGLEKLSSNTYGIFYDDVNISTYSDKMASEISQVIDNHMFHDGMVTIDIIPQKIKSHNIRPENYNENMKIENVVKKDNIDLENKNYLTSYTNLINSSEETTTQISAENTLSVKNYAAYDIDNYKETFLKTSVSIDKNGNYHTNNSFISK